MFAERQTSKELYMWTMRASSFPKKMPKPIANKANIVALDDVDSRWNNVLTNFEADQVDGQESLGYDELDPGDDATTTHSKVQVVAIIKTSKSGVSMPNIALHLFLVPCLM
jgi:hypothetical protein